MTPALLANTIGLTSSGVIPALATRGEDLPYELGASTKVAAVDAFRMDVPLKDPFAIAPTTLRKVQSVAVRLTLGNGVEGWGEVPILHPVTCETQNTALQAVREGGFHLLNAPVNQVLQDWQSLSGDLKNVIPHQTASRAGIEMALLDALTKTWGIPLYQFFGGASTFVDTDVTIPLCEPVLARSLATQYKSEGFGIIKTKVGEQNDEEGIGEDLVRLLAILEGHPQAQFILDANEGFSAQNAVSLLQRLRTLGIKPILFEQPVPRDDYDGMVYVAKFARTMGIPVAADESLRNRDDLLFMNQTHSATVMNLKLVKLGILESLLIAVKARELGLGLMIGGMVETRIAMGFAAHFAAGLGGFQFVDLDTPHLLAADPVHGGYVMTGPRLDLSSVKSGHGGTLNVLVDRVVI